MNNQTEVFSIPCRKFTGNSDEVPACRSDCPCDGRPQVVGQHSTVTDTGSTAPAIDPPVVTNIEVLMLFRKLRLAHKFGEENFSASTWVLLGIINELISSRELLRKVALTLPNDSQPDPIMPIGGGRYVDLSRVQDIEPKQQQVCLTLVSGAVAWAPVEMAGELIQAWAAIRRAQVWGRAK